MSAEEKWWEDIRLTLMFPEESHVTLDTVQHEKLFQLNIREISVVLSELKKEKCTHLKILSASLWSMTDLS